MAELDRARIAELIAPFRVKPGRRVRLPGDFPTEVPRRRTKDEAKALLARGVQVLAEYQSRLAAQDRESLLIVLQAMDAAGKDSTIRHVMSGVNPQGVEVHGFKAPSAEELDHDFLWRYQRKLPARGHIGIFNRSHYEEVLVVRVHPEILARQKLPRGSTGRDIWKRRYREINDWERYLTDQGVRIVKLFLHLSREKQRRRFLDRIDEPEKNWKFSAADARERGFWDDYQAAYSEMLSHTSTAWAPWYVIPADRKPFARLVAAAAIGSALMEIDPQYPAVSTEQLDALQDVKRELEAEAPDGPPTGSKPRAGMGRAPRKEPAAA